MIHTLLFTSSVLILGIFCVRKLTFEKISMKARYALWLPVMLRLLFPFSVGESAFSVLNVFFAALPEIRQMQAETEDHGVHQTDFLAKSDVVDAAGSGGQDALGQSAADVLVPGQILRTETPVLGQRAGAGDDTSSPQTSFWAVHPDFWRLSAGVARLVGFLAVGAYMLLSRRRFVRYLKQNRSALLEDALPKAFVKRFSTRGIRVYQVQGLPSPCLVGRDIYIGSRAAADPQSLGHILAHEYSHALHWDGWWAFLRCFLVALYWFDPFVWAAAYAARQDSELACDEAAVLLLGESQRFAYGRTLLNLLENDDEKETCPGMAFMLHRGEKAVRERIGALAVCGRKKKAAAVLVLFVVLLLCGCAFSGAAQGDAPGAGEESADDGQDAASRQAEGRADETQKEELISKNAEKFAVVSAETKTISEEEADQAAFEEALHYHGVMEGRDDSELALKRQMDYQAYYRFTRGEAENPMEDGWYLLGEKEDAGISLYGLYTEAFGFRGLKTLIGEDVNTFDGQWCASPMNGLDDNIRVLELAQDGLPRRFVWKLLAQESGRTEIWRFYSAYRYDTGTVEVKTLTEDDCLSWAREHLTFTVDQDAAQIDVICDGDMYLGAIDISAYADLKTEEVQIVPDVVGFALDDPGADRYQAYSDAVWEKTALHLTVGQKFAGVEGLWFDRLPVLAIQIAADEDSASGFRLDYPRIDETFMARAPWQEKELAKLRDGISSGQAAGSEETDGSAGAGRNDLEKPLINEGEGHHDLAIDFSNPCPGYKYISVWYGEGIDPATEKPRAHTGVDMAADEGADILAAADGKVFSTGFDGVNGNYVVLWHGQSGQMTYYAHCKTVEVSQGQEVSQGEKIATVGQTGQATGPCLHFAISSENNWEEPFFLQLE